MIERRPLPQRRPSVTFDMCHGKPEFKVTVGYYPNFEIGEIFISGAKAGSDLEAVARDAAVILSIAAQYGVPLDVIRHALTREQDGTPSSIIGRVLDQIEPWS